MPGCLGDSLTSPNHFVMISSNPSPYPFPILLKSERLILRSFLREDLDAEDAWPSFDEPIFHQYNPPRDSPESKDRRYQAGHKVFDFKLAILDGSVNVGYLGLYQSDLTARSAWMGIAFAANQRGKGYCKEALAILRDAFFDEWAMERMLLEVAIFNLSGIHCYEATGFLTTKRFWHPHAYQRHLDFEHDPRLEAIKQHFRHGEHDVEVEYLEMEMTRESAAGKRR